MGGPLPQLKIIGDMSPIKVPESLSNEHTQQLTRKSGNEKYMMTKFTSNWIYGESLLPHFELRSRDGQPEDLFFKFFPTNI